MMTPNELHLEYELRMVKRDYSAACKALHVYDQFITTGLNLLEELGRSQIHRDTVLLILQGARSVARDRQREEIQRLDDLYRKQPLPQVEQ